MESSLWLLFFFNFHLQEEFPYNGIGNKEFV